MSDTLWPFYHLHRLKLGAVLRHFRSTQREQHGLKVAVGGSSFIFPLLAVQLQLNQRD